MRPLPFKPKSASIPSCCASLYAQRTVGNEVEGTAKAEEKGRITGRWFGVQAYVLTGQRQNYWTLVQCTSPCSDSGGYLKVCSTTSLFSPPVLPTTTPAPGPLGPRRGRSSPNKSTTEST